MDLWSRINAKSVYIVDFDTEELIQKAIAALNSKLRVSKIHFQVETGAMAAIRSKEELLSGASFVKEESASYGVTMTVNREHRLHSMPQISEKEKGLDVLRCLVYDFLKAEEAIQASVQYANIHEWVEAVIEKLEPSVKNYSKKQIDLTMALILHEKAIRDAFYRDVYSSFTEAYKNGGGVF